jgi:hypothetical protein
MEMSWLFFPAMYAAGKQETAGGKKTIFKSSSTIFTAFLF